jgi:conjugative relaxase-like TrwC/TraI family protein
MLRVTTLYASSAIATALYYTRYLAGTSGEEPGVWCGDQAIGLGLSGGVAADDLRTLLEGRDPTTGTPLGSLLVDRTVADASVVRAVAGFDATFSAPKSVSVWWALTGDPGLLEAHDLAVRTALDHLERYGATTRVRVHGHRQHPDTGGLSVATFRQTTSRADDPQLHTHAVISAKVQTDDGRWWALDARYLKRNQRMLGGLYQSVLRAELTHRYGIGWEPIVNGQAEIAGMPAELLEVFSKRAGQVDAALAVKVDEFRQRRGRDPSRWERAALCREASADTRVHKTGNRVSDLATRWQDEAGGLGWAPRQLVAAIDDAGRDLAQRPVPTVTVEQVVDQLSASGSTWTRADILRAICDLQPAVSPMSGHRWAAALERGCDQVIDHCVDLDPAGERLRRRVSDGRSVWLEPTAAHFTSETILAEEELVLAWAIDAQADEPEPSTTIERAGLDVLQADAAAAVAGADRLVLVVGPAGAGKTTMLQRAVDDLAAQHRPVFGVAPTAKAARVLQRETGMAADTVAKLLHEWSRADRPPLDFYCLPAGTTLIVDEAGMIGTASLHRLVTLAGRHGWRVALVGDPGQLQAVGRGGLFNELCTIGRVHELSRIHRFNERWEAAASLQLRAGDLSALDAYQAHDRITANPFDDHLADIADQWIELNRAGKTVAITASTNEHVDAINDAVQRARLVAGQLESDDVVRIAGGEHAHPGDMIATRCNDRDLHTSAGEPVRNRDLWSVTAAHPSGALTVSHLGRHGVITLPPDYVNRHVRLGYAATEHGNQSDTVDVGIALVSTATTHRGLYVAMTRGRDDNRVHVITETTDVAEARDVLECVLAHDRADIPAVTQRRDLALQVPPHEPTPGRRAEPTSIIPDWVAPWRTQLEQHRDDLARYLIERAGRRADATNELLDLQPALTAARTAWQPYAQPIAEIEDQLRTDLRPAMWKANHEAMHAGFGHRHGAGRQAKIATGRVDDAEVRIAAIRDHGADIKQRLDGLEAEARNLHDVAHPAPGGYGLEDFNRDQLDRIEPLLDAVDIWATWAHGRPVPTADLVTAVSTLTDAARRAPLLAVNDGEIDRTQWFDALQPVTELLRMHGVQLSSGRDLELERGPELGIDL